MTLNPPGAAAIACAYCSRKSTVTLRPFAKALKDGDMLFFAKGAFLISLNGMEDVLVPWMREFRKIPAVKFKDEKGNWPEAVKVRTAEVDGHRHAYVVNTGFEPVEVDLLLEEDRPEEARVVVVLGAFSSTS